jgi:uncharacterized membrane protein YqjE
MRTEDRSIADVISSAVTDAQDLVRGEIALAKAELRDEVRRIGAGAAMLAAAGLAAIVGLVMLLTAVAWAISELAAWPVWAGFGVVTVVVLLIAGVLAFMGKSRLASERRMPLTVDTMKENMKWMRARTS